MKKKSKFSKKTLTKSKREVIKFCVWKKKTFLLSRKPLEKDSKYSSKRLLTTSINKILIIWTKNLRKKDTIDIKSDQTSSILLFFLVEFTTQIVLNLKLIR